MITCNKALYYMHVHKQIHCTMYVQYDYHMIGPNMYALTTYLLYMYVCIVRPNCTPYNNVNNVYDIYMRTTTP